MRYLGLISLLALLAAPAAAADAADQRQQLHFDEFSKTQICPCDCVYQYKIVVDVAQYRSLTCKALYDDGEWAEISQNQYAPSDQLLFFSPDDITGFECAATLAQQSPAF